jgi:hypothetical protein
MDESLNSLIKDFRIFIAKNSIEATKFGSEYNFSPQEIVLKMYPESFPYKNIKEIFIDVLYYATQLSGSVNLNSAYSELLKLAQEEKEGFF